MHAFAELILCHVRHRDFQLLRQINNGHMHIFIVVAALHCPFTRIATDIDDVFWLIGKHFLSSNGKERSE